MDYEKAKAERDFRTNPPENAPGGANDDGWDDIFDSPPEQSKSAENTNIYDTDINQTLNNAQGNVQQNPQMQGGKSTEDMMIEGAVYVGKGLGKYIMIVANSFKNNKPGDWHNLGVTGVKLSLIGVIIGFLFCIINIFRNTDNQPLDLVIGSLVSLMVSIGLCMFFDKDNNTVEDTPDVKEAVEEDEDDWGDILDDLSNSTDDEEGNTYAEEEYAEEEYEEEDWDDFLEDDSYNIYNGSSVESENFNLEEALDNVVEITKGTQTRSYLYETFMGILPKINPQFNEMHQITRDETEFYDFEDMLRSAAYQVGMKDEQIPELESLFENDFLYRLNCTRPPGLKEQLIGDEIAETFSRDDMNRQVIFGSYAMVETSVGKFTINIFKGFRKDPSGKQIGGVTISLGDVYSGIKDYICDTKNEIPLVWGINEFGDPYYCDMKDNNSIIISGEPRGGKSWKGQSIVAQLAMFHSPKELEFYFFDGKDDASDYRYPATVLPHAKYFCGDMDKINDGLEAVINMMVEERGKKITEAGHINIKDYNRNHPDDKIPYVYVVIDELQSLMNHFVETDQKDEAARFRSFLSTMVSKLPYTGIRFILFPHRIVNDVISKNTYSLVSCRAVVRQTNMGELKNAVEVTEKTFPYKLAGVGDMALKMNEINGGNVVYCHSEILTTTNESNRNLFDFIGAVWKKLEPDCQGITINGSIGGHIGSKVYNGGSSGSNSTPRKPARDNTVGEESFSYSGFETGESVENSMGNMNDDLGVDEDFWNNF